MSTHVGLNPEVLEGCTRSELQRTQSRLNGAKSRGPKTIAGREKSKMNATKLGLRARTLVLPGESAEDYQHWVQCTIESLKPRDDFELQLARRTASDAESGCGCVLLTRTTPLPARWQPISMRLTNVKMIASLFCARRCSGTRGARMLRTEYHRRRTEGRGALPRLALTIRLTHT